MTGSVAFLTRYAPFRELDAERLEKIAAGLRVASYPPGTVILRQSGDPAGSLFMIREGIVDLLDEDRAIDHMGEGEIFGISVLSGLGPALSVRARTATECYLIDAGDARELMGSATGLAYLASAATHWRERVSVEHHVRRAETGDDLAEEIGGASGGRGLDRRRGAASGGRRLHAGSRHRPGRCGPRRGDGDRRAHEAAGRAPRLGRGRA